MSYFLEYVWDLLPSPSSIVGYLVSFLSWLIGLASELLSPSLKSIYDGVSSTLINGPVRACLLIALYFLEPVCRGVILVECSAAAFIIWAFCLILKFVLWIKGHIYSQSA